MLCVVAEAADERASIEELMSRFGSPDYEAKPFIERRQNKMLREPLVLKGEVILVSDRTLTKIISEPFQERISIGNGRLEMERGGRKRSVALRQNRGAEQFYKGLLAFLEHDVDTLLKYFLITDLKAGDMWTVELAPRNDELKKIVERMLITGLGSNINTILTVQSEENWQEMSFVGGETGSDQ